MSESLQSTEAGSARRGKQPRGTAAAKAGIQQGQHNEGFEVSTVDGQRTYDVLMGLLDPNLIKFQFQMSTISQGFVASDYFTKYPGRFFSMHVQDVDLHAAPASVAALKAMQV